MGHFCTLILSICFSCLRSVVLCKKGNVFAFTGCNVTLKWILENKSFHLERTNAWIVDTSGNVVFQANEDNCSARNNDSSLECIVSKLDNQLTISLVIMNAITYHSGNYTVWYKQGMVLQNITKEVIILDMPHIWGNGKPVLHESFTVRCNTSYISDSLIYYWKRNGTYVDYTSQERADSSTLIFANITEMDILSNLTCEVQIRDCSNMECKDCCECSEESEPLKVVPFYTTTAVSSSLPDENESQPLGLLWVGLITAVVFLLIIGCCILVTLWRIYASIEIALTKDAARKNKVSESVPLQTLHSSLRTTERPHRDRLNIDDSENNKSSDETGSLLFRMEPYIHCCGLLQLFVRAKWDKRAASKEFHEERNSVIDEAALSVYDHADDNVIEKYSHEVEMTTEHDHCDVDVSIEVCQYETAHMEAFQTYITPISGHQSPIELCQDEESNLQVSEKKDVHAIYENSITSINRLAHPIETCQVVVTNWQETYKTYDNSVSDLDHSVEVFLIEESDLHVTKENEVHVTKENI